MYLVTIEKACEVQWKNKTHLDLSAITQIFNTLRVYLCVWN
jgi:hypothetical protein